MKGDIKSESYRHESSFERGHYIYVQKFFVENHHFEKRLSFVFFHDFGEHSGRYKNFVIELCHEFASFGVGLECFVLDLPGHGKSTGIRGHIKSFDETSRDYIDFINKDVGGDMIFFGNSVGALVAINILHSLSEKLRGNHIGAVLINPAFKLRWSIPNFLRSNFLSSFAVFQKMKLPFIVSGSDMVGVSDEAEVFDADPLNCHSPTVSTYLEIENMGKKLRTSSYYLTTPVFMALSDRDDLYDHDLSEVYFRGLERGTAKKYFRTPHDLLTNQVAKDVIQDIVKWYKSLNGV